jgi:hypothetical protein
LENREQLVFSCGILRHFINGSLDLSREKTISGFELSEPLLDAAAYNTYVETVSNKADTLYLRIKEGLTEMVKHSYLNYISRMSEKFDWKNKEFVLAFDYTDEDFYGDVQGLDIYGWTGENGVKGKFKFLTCSIISDEIPQKIPLISIPVKLGHNMSYAVTHCLYLIKPLIGEINLVLFDRWFYSKELMYDLNELKIPYLIFVPKKGFIKSELKNMQDEEKKIIEHEYKLNRDKSTYNFESRLAFLKQIFCKGLNKNLDWVFATNVDGIKLDEIIQTYKKRWRIETGFRVQDEARIKCKSKDMKIRYFIFMFEQMLQTQWACFYKDKINFKQFLIEIHKVCKTLVENPKRSYGKSQKTQV